MTDTPGVRDERILNDDEGKIVKLASGLEVTVRYPEELSVAQADCVPEIESNGDGERKDESVLDRESVRIAVMERRVVTLAVNSAVDVWTSVLTAVSLGAPLGDAPDDGVARDDCADDVDSSAVGLGDSVESTLDEPLNVAPPTRDDDEDTVEEISFTDAVGPTPTVCETPADEEKIEDRRADRDDEGLGDSDCRREADEIMLPREVADEHADSNPDMV